MIVCEFVHGPTPTPLQRLYMYSVLQVTCMQHFVGCHCTLWTKKPKTWGKKGYIVTVYFTSWSCYLDVMVTRND